MAKIDHNTTNIAQSDVNTALEALGIPSDLWSHVAEVRIEPRQVTINAYVMSDKGTYLATASSVFGRSAARTTHVFPIVEDRG